PEGVTLGWRVAPSGPPFRAHPTPGVCTPGYSRRPLRGQMPSPSLTLRSGFARIASLGHHRRVVAPQPPECVRKDGPAVVVGVRPGTQHVLVVVALLLQGRGHL